jgi:phenylalanyl-tRNA synthetase beta chain
MNIPYSWLKELLPEVPSVTETADLLASIGLGVERTYVLSAPPKGVVIVRVDEVGAVEGSDHLLLACVWDGQRHHSVVTGAPNVQVGMVTALAKPGTELPHASLTVAARGMAGVRSEGMLCSPSELGLFEYGGGLINLGEDAPVGTVLADVWPEETIIELELTPNRADAFSMLGVARDLAAKLGTGFRHPADGLPTGDKGIPTGLHVEVQDLQACPRFTLRLIEGVTVKPSPLWLQRRLAAVGLRPRNNLVDVTNYVTYELGQPSHAYDRADLTNGTIVVRRAQAGETLTSLTDDVLEFSEQDLLITTPGSDGSGTTPIGVAGVIGGLHHSVKPGTEIVALEVAHFDPVTIRRTAKRLGLSTDAHYRFERGVDPNLPPLAAARAAQLIAEVSGGRLHPGLTEYGGDQPLRAVPYRPSRMEFLMAMHVPLEEQRCYLQALGCNIEERGHDDWLVTTPSWRFDLAIEEDLIEEVARLHGYHDIPETIPAMHFVPEARDSTHRSLRNLLAGMGFLETINYVFTSDDELDRAGAPQASVRLVSPPSAERSVLRTALYPGMLGAARTNHAASGLALFEVGRVFNQDETERLTILARGTWAEGGWLPSQKVDFYLFKGLLEKLARTLGVEVTLEPHAYAALHPGVSATVLWSGRKTGFMGRLHPEIAARYDLPETYILELDLPLVGADIRFRDYARQPHAERDLAIVAPKQVTYAELQGLVRNAGGDHLESITPFDVYEGRPIPEDRRSVALRFRFRHPERALRDDELDMVMTNIITTLEQAGYDIRDK